MSEVDLPARIAKYGGSAELTRIALTRADCATLPSFPVDTKRSDPRYRWWQTRHYGPECWEVDALDPRELRARVEAAIEAHLDPEAWDRCEVAEKAEKASMQAFFNQFESILEQDSE